MSFINSKKLIVVALLIIVGMGAWIRIAPIASGNTLFQYDHGRDLWDVKKIVYDLNPTLIGPDTGLHGVFNGPYHYYFLAIAMAASNGHPMAGSFLNALVHVLAIAGCFASGYGMVRLQNSHKLNFDKSTADQQKKSMNRLALFFGLLVALFYAFSRGAVSVTVFFWNPNWIPAVMVPYIYFLWRGVVGKDKWGLIWAGFFGGIAANTELAFGVWLIAVYTVSVSVLWPAIWKSRWGVLGLVTYFMHFLPQVIFDLRNNFLMTRAIWGLLSGNNVSLGRSLPLEERLGIRAMELFTATGGALSADENRIWTILLTILLAAGMAYLVMKERAGLAAGRNNEGSLVNYQVTRNLVFLVIPFAVYYVCFVLYPRVAWPWYWIGLQTYFYFLCAYVVWKMAIDGGWLRYVALGLTAFWLVLTIPFYFKDPTFLADEPGRFSHMLAVVDAVFEDARDKPFGVYTFTLPIRDYAFSYVFWWRGRTKYNYEPYTAYALRDGEKVPDNFYLVIEAACSRAATEPDCTGKTARRNDWELNSTPRGQEMWRKEFAGRIEVVKKELRQ